MLLLLLLLMLLMRERFVVLLLLLLKVGPGVGRREGGASATDAPVGGAAGWLDGDGQRR